MRDGAALTAEQLLEFPVQHHSLIRMPVCMCAGQLPSLQTCVSATSMQCPHSHQYPSQHTPASDPNQHSNQHPNQHSNQHRTPLSPAPRPKRPPQVKALHGRMLQCDALQENEALIGFKKQVEVLRKAQDAAFVEQQRQVGAGWLVQPPV